MKALEERDKDRVTVRNVFEIASKNANKKGEMRKLDQLEADQAEAEAEAKSESEAEDSEESSDADEEKEAE
jgi:predicted peptidase